MEAPTGASLGDEITNKVLVYLRNNNFQNYQKLGNPFSIFFNVNIIQKKKYFKICIFEKLAFTLLFLVHENSQADIV